MTKNNNYVSLSHTSIHLDLNNKNDVDNIDLVLNLIVENRQDQRKLKEILENTSFKYLKRLQDDGLIADKGGPNIVPIYNPIVSEEAIKFKSKGGYTSLLKARIKTEEPAKWIRWLSKWWWSFLVPLIIGLILLAIKEKWFQ